MDKETATSAGIKLEIPPELQNEIDEIALKRPRKAGIIEYHLFSKLYNNLRQVSKTYCVCCILLKLHSVTSTLKFSCSMNV